MIYLGADHGGVQLKSKIIRQLADQTEQKGMPVKDLGVFDERPADYPLIAQKLAEEVIKSSDNLGILICRSGQGVCIAANKVKGVRAALAWKPELAQAGREHDQINILCLSADYVDEATNLKIVESFLKSQIKPEQRYHNRIEQIAKIESKG